MAELISEEYIVNAQNKSNLSITSNDINIELSKEFLVELHKNAYHGWIDEDVMDHIANVLEMIDLIYIPGVDSHQLRMKVFPLSLADDARQWWINEGEGKITVWEELVEKFFCKFYPDSYDGEEEMLDEGDNWGIDLHSGNNNPIIKWDPAKPRFEGWLATKFSDKEETAEIFKIETDIFDYETPLCLAFNEFNYLLKVDPDLLTKDIMGFKTYEDYKDDWIYEWNKNVPWVYDKPWLDNGIWKEPKLVEHTCKPFNYKTRCSKWPTCSWREDGYCNGGNFPGAYHIGNSLHYQDLEWYEALEDSELKDEALRNKAIMEGLISDDESSNDCWKRWKSHEIYYHNYDEGEYKNKTHEEEHELCGIETHQVPVCQIKRYKMIKYSFNDEEEYVAVKEDEYDDLTITSEEACRAYQEIFRMMDEGWMVTRTE
ncbi:hypothetical protein Tco_1324479 [Tanacetum coccineum]